MFQTTANAATLQKTKSNFWSSYETINIYPDGVDELFICDVRTTTASFGSDTSSDWRKRGVFYRYPGQIKGNVDSDWCPNQFKYEPVVLDHLNCKVNVATYI